MYKSNLLSNLIIIKPKYNVVNFIKNNDIY